jgi:hypothetical protein
VCRCVWRCRCKCRCVGRGGLIHIYRGGVRAYICIYTHTGHIYEYTHIYMYTHKPRAFCRAESL